MLNLFTNLSGKISLRTTLLLRWVLLPSSCSFIFHTHAIYQKKFVGNLCRPNYATALTHTRTHTHTHTHTHEKLFFVSSYLPKFIVRSSDVTPTMLPYIIKTYFVLNRSYSRGCNSDERNCCTNSVKLIKTEIRYEH